MRRTKDACDDGEDGQDAHVVSVSKIDDLVIETLLEQGRVEHGVVTVLSGRWERVR